MSEASFSRRAFLRLIGSSSAIAIFPVSIGGCGKLDSELAPVDLLYWVTINADNTVTVKIPQTEIGQGVTTTIAQLLAEELEADWDGIQTEFYDPNIHLQNGEPFVWTTTLGSLSAHYLFDPARIAGAQIRLMLIEAASMTLGVSEGSLSAERSFVIHASSGRKVSYAEIAEEASTVVPPDPNALILKEASDWRLIGKHVDRLDSSAAARGETIFGIDVDLPGMRFAAIRQSPVFGGSLESIDDSRLKDLPGAPEAISLEGGHVGYNSPVPEGEDPELWAVAVTTDDAVAVVADSWWQAATGLEALDIKWVDGPNEQFSSEGLKNELSAKLDETLPYVETVGDVTQALENSNIVHTAEYFYPFMDPAPLEPLNCTVLVNESSVTVWTGTQYSDDVLRMTSEITGIPSENVSLQLMPAGGGFGRRLQNDFVYQAVQIANAYRGIPIKLLWSREECIRRSCYAPMTLVRYRGAIDSDGQISAWICKAASGKSADQAYGSTRIPFHFRNSRIEYDRSSHSPVPFGWMRGVGFTQHVWMNFGFLDELARLAKRDPANVYKELLEESAIPEDIPDRNIAVARARGMRRVLEFALDHVKWHERKSREFKGRGLAVSDSEYYAGYGGTSTKAAVVDVTIGRDGDIMVDKVFIAISCGTVINPDIVRAQLEGGVAYALTVALHSQITVEDGQVQQSNFHDYRILQMQEMPMVEIEILPSTGTPLSVGEDAVPVTIAALVNAIADAGGPRIRSLPIRSTA